MTSDYILTSFKIEDEYYECQCGCCIGLNEDYDMFYTLGSWKYCPKCGEKRVRYITEDEACFLIESWLAGIGLAEYTDTNGIDYPAIEWAYSQDSRYDKVLCRSFDDFKKLIDKARKIDKCGA